MCVKNLLSSVNKIREKHKLHSNEFNVNVWEGRSSRVFAGLQEIVFSLMSLKVCICIDVATSL